MDTSTLDGPLDPYGGAMVRLVRQPGRLLIVIHHAVIDGVSWRLLLMDLASAWAAVSGCRPPRPFRERGVIASRSGCAAHFENHHESESRPAAATLSSRG